MNIPTQLKFMMAAGSVGACVGLYALLAVAARVVPTGGVDATQQFVILSSSAVPAFFIGWASWVFTQQLRAEIKREKSGGQASA